jgi:hypothetical protein
MVDEQSSEPRSLTSKGEGLETILERVLTEARGFTRAEAGSIYVRDENRLRFAAVQNDVFTRRYGEEEMRRRLLPRPLELSQPSLAGYVGLTGRTLNVQDAYRIPSDRPYRFERAFDERNNYLTVSVFLVPIHDQSRNVIGVLQLINALDAQGQPIPFRPPYGFVQRTLASYAAIAIQNAKTTTADTQLATEKLPVSSRPDGSAGSPVGSDTPPVSPGGRRLGELLTAQGLISPAELDKALAEQNRTKEKLGTILARMGLISEDRLVEFLARRYGIQILTFLETMDPELLRLVPSEGPQQ